MREQEVRELYEAYLQVHRVQEEVEVVDESREANRDPEGYEERQRTSQSSRQRRMNDPNTGINSPAFHAFMAQQMGGKKKKKVDEETDLFDTILEYLVAEGYANTNEAALAIMANMSEEWKQSIVEGYGKNEEDCVDKKDKNKHNCAKKVCHEEFGEGTCIYGQHAEPDRYGFVSHYDVLFEHGIEKAIPTSEMEILVSESHGGHMKK